MVNQIDPKMALVVIAPTGVVTPSPEPTHRYDWQKKPDGFILENGAEWKAHGSGEKGSLVDFYI